MKKVYKVPLIIFGGLLISVLAVAFIAPFFLEGSLQNTLKDKINTQTDGKLTLDLSSVDIGIISRTVSLDSIVVQPDSTSRFIKKFTVESISLKGISWWSLWRQSIPDFTSVIIINPDIEIYERDFSDMPFPESEDSTNTGLTAMLSSFDLILKNGKGRMLSTGDEEIFAIEDLSINAKNIDIEELLDGSELIFIEGLEFNGSGLRWKMEDELYDLSITDFSFDEQTEDFTINDLSIKPMLPKYEFSQRKGYQTNRLNVEIPQIKFSGFNLTSLSSDHLEIDTLGIYNAEAQFFRNKQIPRASGDITKPLMNEIANSINFSFELNTAIVSNATIVYEEHKPPSESTGTISFDELNATITHFRSASHPDFATDSLRLYAETLFMDSAPLTVDVSYAVFDERDSHTVRTSLKSMDPKIAQNVFENVGFVRVDEGLVESMEAKFSLNDVSSSGEVLILYRDLKVSFLDKKDPESDGIKQKVTDFLANTFAIKSDNTGDDPRVGKINFERELEKAIFAYWWKSLLSGIKDTIK